MSTSAINIPGKLGSPWEYPRQVGDADRAFALLVEAVKRTSGAMIKTVDTNNHYLLAQFSSKVLKKSIAMYADSARHYRRHQLSLDDLT